MIFGDNDASFAGQAAAFSLAERLRAEGITTVVELPDGADKDWNDVHRERRG